MPPAARTPAPIMSARRRAWARRSGSRRTSSCSANAFMVGRRSGSSCIHSRKRVAELARAAANAVERAVGERVLLALGMHGEHLGLELGELPGVRARGERLEEGVGAHGRGRRGEAHERLSQGDGEAVGVDGLGERHALAVPGEHAHDGAEVLGRDVTEGAGDGAEGALVGGDAEVEDEGVDVAGHVGQEEVVGLDVLVAEAGVVHGREPARDGDEDRVRLAEGERAPGDALAERRALVERHGEPHVRDRAVRVEDEPVVGELDDVRVRDGREAAHLLIRVARREAAPAHDLEGDAVLGHVHVARLEDLPGRALAQPREEPVAPGHDLVDRETTRGGVRLHRPAERERASHGARSLGGPRRHGKVGDARSAGVRPPRALSHGRPAVTVHVQCLNAGRS